MKKRFVPEPEPDIGLQIAPMVNLMFVLLAAFTVSAGQKIVEAELGVKVPGQAKENPTEQNVLTPPVNLRIRKEGKIEFNGSLIGEPEDKQLEDLRAKLLGLVELSKDQAVIIRPEEEVEHQRVVDVLNACSAAKVNKLSFGR